MPLKQMDANRRDGRRNDESRPITISYDGLVRVDGSARFAFGDTNALASISGPIEVRLAAEQPSKATFEVLVRPLANVPATDSKSLAASLRSCLEPSLILTKNPRSLVQLVIQSLTPWHPNTWNSTLAASMVNASTLALLNTGSVPMQGAVIAVAVGRIPGGPLIVDPSDEEAERLASSGCFAFQFSGGVGRERSKSDCVWAGWKASSGGYDEKELFEAKELARIGSQAVYMLIRRQLSQEVEQEMQKVKIADEEVTDEDGSDDEKMVI